MTSPTSQPWSYQGNKYLVSRTSGEPSYKKCAEVVRKFVKDSDVHVPAELKRKNVAAFSYFYDRAVDSGILDAGSQQGSAKLISFIEAANKACVSSVPDDASFLCVDLTFIVTLLADGYGLTPDKEIHICKKINGHETSWALGVAYNLVE